jgi:mono/diheme cytochrome c family protein
VRLADVHNGRSGRFGYWSTTLLLLALRGCTQTHGQPQGATARTPQSPDAQVAATPGIGQPSPDDRLLPLRDARSALPDATSPGARLVVEYCSQCHAVPSPTSQTSEDWVPIARNMFLRMERTAHMNRMMAPGMMAPGMVAPGTMGPGMMGRGPMHMNPVGVPSPEQQRVILQYLQSHALRAAPPRPVAPGPGARLYRATCSKCHALPDPASHPAAEWPGIVRRMREYMQRRNIGDVTDAQARAIQDYLESTAQGREEPTLRPPGDVRR